MAARRMTSSIKLIEEKIFCLRLLLRIWPSSSIHTGAVSVKSVKKAFVSGGNANGFNLRCAGGVSSLIMPFRLISLFQSQRADQGVSHFLGFFRPDAEFYCLFAGQFFDLLQLFPGEGRRFFPILIIITEQCPYFLSD